MDHILYTPRIGAPSRPSDDEPTREQIIAEKKQAFLNAWWDHAGEALTDGRKLLVGEGMLALRVTLDWTRIPLRKDFSTKSKYNNELDRLGRNGFLWDVQVLDNRTVYPDPSNHRDPRYCFVQYDILREDAKELFPKSEAEWTKGADYSTVEYTEYWSYSRSTGEGRYVQWIDGDDVHNKDNPYPYVPVAIDDSGYGINTRISPPEEKFVGLTRHMRDVFVAEARQMTSLEAVAEYTAFPVVIRRNMDETKQIQIGPGEAVDLQGGENDPDGENITLLQWPEVPVTVLQLLNKTNEMANSTLKMDVLGGVPLRGVETASEAQSQIQNAASKLSGPVNAMERLVKRISSWVLIDVEKVLEAPVTLYATASGSASEVRLQPKEINGY